MFMVAAANVGLAVFLPVYAQGYLGLSPAGSGYALLGFLLGRRGRRDRSAAG